MDARHDMGIGSSQRLARCIEQHYKAADLLGDNGATSHTCVSYAYSAAPAGGDSADQP